jgi:protein-L-isoaspartate(D-aspartate) O-methyltransferase
MWKHRIVVAACFISFFSFLAGNAGHADVIGAAGEWKLPAFHTAFSESGRILTIDDKQFVEIQKNKEKALASIEEYLTGKFGQADPAVMKAFREVPREYFMYNYESKKSFATDAYSIPATAWAIGYGSALSDYLGQAYMTQIVKPKPTDVVLEVGTGSGFQIALLSRIVREAYSIEIITSLGDDVHRIFAPLSYTNVQTRVGDGFFGWPEVKGGFDIIIVTCAAPYVPPPLLQQLKKHGRMIIPIGQPYTRDQFFYIFTKDQDGKIHSRKDIGCYFIPMTGQVQK